MTGQAIVDALRPGIRRRTVVTIAGESGSGKTTLAFQVADALRQLGSRTYVLHMDDYFRLPPVPTHARREEDLGWVGLGEVHLDRLEAHARQFLAGEPIIRTPRLADDEQHFEDHALELDQIDILIVEGTYVTRLRVPALHIFIDITHEQTLAARRARGRNPIDDELTPRILAIEHEIISTQKRDAHVVVDYQRRMKLVRSPS